MEGRTVTYNAFDIMPESVDVSFFHEGVFILKERCTFKVSGLYINLFFDNDENLEPYKKLRSDLGSLYQTLFEVKAECQDQHLIGTVSADKLECVIKNNKFPYMAGHVLVHSLEVEYEGKGTFDKSYYAFEHDKKRNFINDLKLDNIYIKNPNHYGIPSNFLYSINGNFFEIKTDDSSVNSLEISEESLGAIDDLAREAVMLANFFMGSDFDWIERKCFYKNKISHYKYFMPTGTECLNKVSLQLNSRSGFSINDFFEKNFTTKGRDYYIDHGIFSAIKNYSIVGGFNEYFHIRQLAPLENLVKKNMLEIYVSPLIFKNPSQQKKFFRSVKAAIKDIENLSDCLDTSYSCEEKKRAILKYSEFATAPSQFTFPLKDIISNFLTIKFSANEYEERNREFIKSACELRNEIAHNGWITNEFREKSSLSLNDLAFFTRELGQLIILLLLGVNGDFTSFRDKKLSYRLKGNTVTLIDN